MVDRFERPPDPDLTCPLPACGERLVVVESGWVDPRSLTALEPDVAVYTLECPKGHGRYEFVTGQSLRPIVG